MGRWATPEKIGGAACAADLIPSVFMECHTLAWPLHLVCAAFQATVLNEPI